MSAYQKDIELCGRILRCTGVSISIEQANTLRRAELTLHRWAELECGDGNEYGSWCIERDEKTEVPYLVHHHYQHGRGKDFTTRNRVADREAGALKRVAALCASVGLHFHHQTDPRGCQLYVSNEPLTSSNYTHGACCSVGN
jgi:hypothetical protein